LPAVAGSEERARAHPDRPAREAPKAEAGDSEARRQQRLQAEQRELRARLAQLKQQLASTEAAHSEAADALAASESAISAANRKLRELAADRRTVERQIAGLQERQRAVAANQGWHQSALGVALRAQLVLGERRPWQDALDGAAPDLSARDQAYLAYVVRRRVQSIGELRDRRSELAALESESRERQSELLSIAADERASRAQLIKQQAARKATLASLAQDMARQRRSVAGLERDEGRLSSLIEQLDKVLAEQARRRAARAAAARPKAPAEASAEKPQAPEPSAAARLAPLRGKLQLPVRGEIAARFGSPRRGDDGEPQAGAPAWKGLFIRAPAGEEVHAVAAGRVVFADWLRGFGNLMIVDHGDGLLSVYGNNQSLLRSVGDPVESGDVIAEVGNTGGNAQSGLYFEMRFQGRPFDPLAWAAAR
jgi:septal ring factor EnvC (AmiA/AmiB activator)